MLDWIEAFWLIPAWSLVKDFYFPLFKIEVRKLLDFSLRVYFTKLKSSEVTSTLHLSILLLILLMLWLVSSHLSWLWIAIFGSIPIFLKHKLFPNWSGKLGSYKSIPCVGRNLMGIFLFFLFLIKQTCS